MNQVGRSQTGGPGLREARRFASVVTIANPDGQLRLEQKWLQPFSADTTSRRAGRLSSFPDAPRRGAGSLDCAGARRTAGADVSADPLNRLRA